jgi:Leucine-rich repeat (LRR) protein
LKHLTALDARRCELKSLPEAMEKLEALESLLLTGNRLEALPAKIFSAQGRLQRLYAEKNKLQAVPETIGDAQNLIELDLAQNQLEAIPMTMERLPALERLRLNENRILDTPHFLGNVASLRDLDISGNSFAMPERIGELHFNGCTFIHAANADAPGGAAASPGTA